MTFISRRHLLAASAATALPLLSRAAHAAGGTTLAQIKSSGELRIGCEAAYVPFTYRQGATIVGYDVELADLLCKPLGVKPVFVDTAWAGVIPSLYTKKFDVVMSSMSYTKERLERVSFTVPYAEASQALLVRAADADRIKAANDLNGRTLAVKLGSPGQILQDKMNASLKSAGGAGFKELRTFDDHPSAYVALAQGRVDGVLNTLATLAMVLKDAPGKYAIVKGMGGDNWAGIAARKEDTEIVEYLNTQLQALKASGAIYQLQEKWFGFRMNLADSIPSFS
ncbi:transporter substrate-binding domain-containing protein [Pseudorhodoferax soli]|uniref:Amino acid ABC transporter substrate-binding protein (PAAT family) n=1 Tax=Pseudorhodoferax soli TaxID=545864 RepID=A0A368Y8D0_9BURK|nr:transporter substrate-binding domain-containing protein [Pseudorhodoferax soli]RCW76355.1 amino acid ABC transporter substrate-binding protein (PAAT family) [Pseudorhodoferax soli]